MTELAVAKSMMHGLTRGVISMAQGGTFKSGFASGFTSSAFSVGTKGYGGFVGRTAIMSVVGGTASKLGGGKFSNGAVSGAFVHMFNSEAGGHGAKRKYDPKVHKKHAEMYDSLAKNTGRLGVVVYTVNKRYGALLIGLSGIFDGLKHSNLYLAGSPDPGGAMVDFAIPLIMMPISQGPVGGEVVSQALEEGINYLDRNYR
ncbi:MAG TPA: hypothetical protein ENK82_09695 [Campylobacterales bacterium]|nr:hypothetical protein [Campylobacterales bacterium]